MWSGRSRFGMSDPPLSSDGAQWAASIILAGVLPHGGMLLVWQMSLRQFSIRSLGRGYSGLRWQRRGEARKLQQVIFRAE